MNRGLRIGGGGRLGTLGAFGVRGGGSSSPVFVLLDNFITAESAPLTSPRTCEPGPGQIIFTDVSGSFSIADGNLQHVNRATNDNGDFSTNPIYALGDTVVVKTTWEGGGGNFKVGVNDDKWIILIAYSRNWYDGPYEGSWTTPVTFASVLTTRGILLINVTTGKLVQVRANASTLPTTQKIRIFASNDTTKTDFVGLITGLPAPWNVDWGLCTNYIASPVAGQTTISETDALVEWKTPVFATNDIMELSFRYTDDNNRWVLRCDQGGSTMKLIQIQNGSETERATTAKTWTVGTAYRLLAQFDGAIIRCGKDNDTAINYNSATFNQTATGAKVSHAGLDFACWPRNVTFPFLV